MTLSRLLLKCMAEVDGPRTFENELVELLGFKAFDFIKLLMKNRLEIVYCERLDRLGDEERKELEKQMSRMLFFHSGCVGSVCFWLSAAFFVPVFNRQTFETKFFIPVFALPSLLQNALCLAYSVMVLSYSVSKFVNP
jgi:hypothetical protein